jgi:predicted nucleic acid-binding protein
LRGRRGVVVDTNVFIYCFEDSPEHGAAAAFVLEEASAGVFDAVVTPITLAEILVKPLKARRADIADRYRTLLCGLPNVTAVTLDPAAGLMAGALRAEYGLPIPAMLQVAVALRSEAPAIITNDRALLKVSEVSVFPLDAFAEAPKGVATRRGEAS